MKFDVLIVEDRQSDLELTSIALLDISPDVVIKAVRNGADALDYIFCQGKYGNRGFKNPSLILLDLNLPQISGIEVLKRIKTTPYTKNIPVVVLTALNEESGIDQCMEYSADDYICKPFEQKDFRAVVKRLGMTWVIPRLKK